MNIFLTFRDLKNIPRHRQNGRFPVPKWPFLGVKELEKAFSRYGRNGRHTVNEMKIFSNVPVPVKSFLATGETAVFQFANCPFLDVSELGKAFSCYRRNGRLTINEMSIFRLFGTWKYFPCHRRNVLVPVCEMNIFWRFGSWETVFSLPAKQPAPSVPEMTIFSVFSGPEKCILATGETAGFPFTMWTFLDVSELEKSFSVLRRNGLLTVPEITIFPPFRDLKKFSSPPEKRPVSRSRSCQFWTFGA